MLASFTVYSLAGGLLTAAVAFPAIALFDVLSEAFMETPYHVQSLIDIRVGLGRLSSFLQASPARCHHLCLLLCSCMVRGLFAERRLCAVLQSKHSSWLCTCTVY